MVFENLPQPGGRTRVIVGIDLGTTFSGISYAVLPQNLNIPISFLWQVDRRPYQKVPTQIEASGTTIEWFKLSLLRRDDLEKDILIQRTVDVAAVYLRRIWKVFREELRYKVTDPHIQITFTVPILWPDYARKSIYEALHQANIINNNVELAPKFVAEPEAAALAIFSAAGYLDGELFSKVRPGQVVIVCDCGGGTTCSYPFKDTAAYEICSVHPFRVREVLLGQRILAEAYSMGDRFMKLMKEKIAQVLSPRAFQALKDEDFARLAYTHWDEGVKMSFSNNFEDKRIELPFHWVGTQRRRMGVRQSVHIEFNHDEIASIFNPIVERITTLIETEMRSAFTCLSKDVSGAVIHALQAHTNQEPAW
ncbi:hypothetical protein FNAPI_7052 [Fusarium napiforme]|uniref:Actin-like protein n=1 Tax=Fusarium napiforme TaxID=42672 RepID=A0A8H5JBS6_9HYPO|nr:hypothetical protein FNAPI_7052 [Fusarium napiforme]